MKSKTKLLGLTSVMALGLVSCANDELKEIYNGEEIEFTTRVSRATITDKSNLNAFRVYADGYSTLLINGKKAEKVKGKDYYALEQKVTWPTDVKSIRFWAYGPDGAGVTPDINASTQQLRNFKVEQNLNEGGKNQTDLVVAYTNITREEASGMQVPLTFNHALSQIEVKIKKGDGYEEGRVVKVKGAWIINVQNTGDLRFDVNSENNNMVWNNSALSMANYGRLFDDGRRLADGLWMLSNEEGADKSSLMVIPQKFEKWVFPEQESATAENQPVQAPSIQNQVGTYILVLCRVETEHNYPATSSGTAENPTIGDLKNDKGEVVGHVHQLFPVAKDNVYNADAYGYTCVPIEGEWLPGKKYVYTLEFCGKDSGAGVYPPEPKPDGLPDGEDRPDGKKPGDPVLDDPITFSVEVSDWESEDKTTPMT